MPAARLNMKVEEGATWDPEFALWLTKTTAEDGTVTYSNPVDLTAWHVRMAWRKDHDTAPFVSLDSAVAASSNGTIIIDNAPGSVVPNRIRPIVPAVFLEALQVSAWKDEGGVYFGVYDIERYEKVASGPASTVVVRRLFKGSLSWDREVTGPTP